MTSPCMQMVYYFVTSVMAVVFILHFTLYQSSKPPFRHERPVILDVTMTNIDSYQRDVYLDWGGTPIITPKFIYGKIFASLGCFWQASWAHWIFFGRGMKTSRCKVTRVFFGLFNFLVDCAGFTDLKTEQLFYKPMTTVAGIDGLVLI